MFRKSLFYFAIFSLIIVSISCSKENNEDQPTQLVEKGIIYFGGLKVKMRKGHSAEELSMTVSDYKQILFSKKSTLKSASQFDSYSFEKLAIISRQVVDNYPRIDTIDYDLIREEFVGLTDEEINSNISVIDSFYTSLMTYDLINEVSKTPVQSSKSFKLKSSYLGYDLTREEFWVLAKYPRIVSDAQAATKAALDLTNQYFPNWAQYQDKADAFRHAIWNAFLGKAAAPYKEWSYECNKFARELSDAHEEGASQPDGMTDEEWALDKNMDLHNNGVGRDYFYVASYSYKRHWYSNRYVKCPSREEMAEAIYSTYIPGAVQVAFSWEPNSYPSKLVYIK